jgi:hypothetical protein
MKKPIKKLKRIDPIDEHEMKIIIKAIECAENVLKNIEYRKFKIKIIEI